MPTARHWTAVQLFIAWVGVLVALVPLRWLLSAGIYEAAIEGGVVRRLSGSWSSGFASSLWLATAMVSVVVMCALTATWIHGRKARASMRAAEASVHRQVLM